MGASAFGMVKKRGIGQPALILLQPGVICTGPCAAKRPPVSSPPPQFPRRVLEFSSGRMALQAGMMPFIIRVDGEPAARFASSTQPRPSSNFEATQESGSR